MLGRPLDAAKNFEIVDELGGSTASSLNNLGDIYANEQLFDLAADAYLRALELEPHSPVDRAMRAAEFMSANSALAEMRALLDGIDHLCQADLNMETRKHLLRLRAKLAAGEGSDAAHHAELMKIIAIDPLDGDALIKLGRYCGRTDKAEEAIAYFEQAANIDGHEAEAFLRHGELPRKTRPPPGGFALTRSVSGTSPPRIRAEVHRRRRTRQPRHTLRRRPPPIWLKSAKAGNQTGTTATAKLPNCRYQRHVAPTADRRTRSPVLPGRPARRAPSSGRSRPSRRSRPRCSNATKTPCFAC